MTITYYQRPKILGEAGLDEGHAVIEASAGTGKTFTLEHLVLDLIIRKEAEVEEILVVTFTDAATRELRERVRGLIRKALTEGETKRPEKGSGDYWRIDDVARRRLQEALFRFDGASISTIHSFCQRILSEQAFLGGRLFEQEHADGAEVFGLAFREEIRAALVEESEVGEQLRLWVERGCTIEDLRGHLYRCHREGFPERCRVTPIWDPHGLREIIASLPSCDELERFAEGHFTGKTARNSFNGIITHLFRVLDDLKADPSSAEAISTFRGWQDKHRTIDKVKMSQAEHLVEALSSAGTSPSLLAVPELIDEIELRLAIPIVFFAAELLPRIQTKLAIRKRALGLLDYDDMLLGVLDALKLDEGGVLVDSLRRRWKYALVDEFQDTDPVQWEIFRRIFVEGKRGHRLFVIGDPKQAIYGFRGADVHTYEVAKNHLVSECGAALLALKENYRSTERLIESVNEILTFEDEGCRRFFGGLNRYDEPVRCGDPRRVAKEAGKPATPIHLVHMHGGGRKLGAAALRKGMGCFIAEEILRLRAGATKLSTECSKKTEGGIALSDIYVLTRSGAEGRRIGEILRRYGIKHAFYKQDGLFQTDEAQEVYLLLRAMDSPEDPARRMSAWLTPFFGVPLCDLREWRDVKESHPLVSTLLEWKRLADAGAWARLFDALINGSGVVRRLVFLQGERELTNYLHVLELLLAESHSRPVTLAELARGLKARIDGKILPEGREGDIQRLETDKDAVQILTIHKAKGLEAEVVFLGGGFTSPPSSPMSIYHRDAARCLHIGKAGGKIAELIAREEQEENQRLAYVALTRAKSRLYLPYFGKAEAEREDQEGFGYGYLGKFYKAIQKHLDSMRAAERFCDESRFVLREFSCKVQPPSGAESEIDLTDWPTEGLLEMPPPTAEQASRIAAGHRGILMTSYTAMTRNKSWKMPAADDSDDRAARRDEEVAAEVDVEEIEVEAAEREEDLAEASADRLEIPKGKEAGIFLHALLEETPPKEIAETTLTDWMGSKVLRRRAEAAARRHGFTEEHLPEALRMVHAAFTTPIRLKSREKKRGNGLGARLDLPVGLASAEPAVAEMPFTYPIPEANHPLFSGAKRTPEVEDRPPYEAVRGFVRGLIDLVFEHDGKIFLLDWKSDTLPAYDEESIDSHIEANYSLQAKVYSIAILRMLGISSEEEFEGRFGGIVYSFIRGVGEEAGVWFSRPSWDDVACWEEELAARSEWGGAAIDLGGERTAGESAGPVVAERKTEGSAR